MMQILAATGPLGKCPHVLSAVLKYADLKRPAPVIVSTAGQLLRLLVRPLSFSMRHVVPANPLNNAS
jgi:hypothetical protein